MRSESYRRYLIGVLLVILIFNSMDRIALGLLLQDIKTELALSDAQLGLLTGLAFALFYSLMGIPIARWADRGDRVTIITVCTGLWCAAVAVCGLAQTFLQLLVARVIVGVGEAGCLPPAQSLISDHFNRAERPKALSIYMLGVPLSAVFGYFFAGWLSASLGWRSTFVLLGLPGIALAVIAWFTLREPRTAGLVVRSSSARANDIGLGQVAAELWRNTTFRHLLLAWSVVSFFGYGIQQWKPAFFIRSFGLQTAEVGTWFAVIYGISGLVGSPLGGMLASRFAASDERLQLKAMALAYCAFGVISAAVYLSVDATMAFVLMGMANLGFYMTYGPLFATIQSLVPERMRAVALATIYLFANLIGMGLGPLAAGALSDGLRPIFLEESLRYSLLVLCPGYAWAGWHLWRASRTAARDLAAAPVA